MAQGNAYVVGYYEVVNCLVEPPAQIGIFLPHCNIAYLEGIVWKSADLRQVILVRQLLNVSPEVINVKFVKSAVFNFVLLAIRGLVENEFLDSFLCKRVP